MATPLNKYNAPHAIGRCVRMRDREHKTGGQGRLVGIDGDYGLVRVNGHGHAVQRFELTKLADDTTANGGALVVPFPAPPPPAPKPVRVPTPSIIEARDQRNRAGRDELRSAMAEAELTDFGDFAGKVRKASADVAAARQMMSDLAATHTREMEDLRAKHKAAEIDAADELKNTEEALAALKSKAATLLTLFEEAKA